MNWAGIINNPYLKDLPFKIEQNRWGKIVMSPASNRHGMLQSEAVFYLRNKMPKGQVIVECSINTSDGVKVADVAWASEAFIDQNGDATPYQQAPEICIEIISPSNSKEEMSQKIELYLAKGAVEVWLCHDNGKVDCFTHRGGIEQSNLAKEKVALFYG